MEYGNESQVTHLYFEPSEVAKVIRHSRANINADIYWFKDVGTGLLSRDSANQIPNAYVYGWSSEGLYLEDIDGADEGFGEVWETTRSICGGDDFAEFVSSAVLPLESQLATATAVRLDITPSTLDFVIITSEDPTPIPAQQQWLKT